MKLISFSRDGEPQVGALLGSGQVLDLTLASGGRIRDMKSVLADPRAAQTLLDLGGRGLDLASLTLLPPVPEPDKIICVGVNYDEHRLETGRSESAYPVLFTRFANTLIPSGAALVRPRVSEMFDFEGELAVIMGRRARHVSEDEALAYVGGYACFVDATVRDWQRHTHQFTPGKNFVGTGAIGPWLTTADEVPDPSALELVTRLNGVEVQRAPTRQMIFSVQRLIAYISTFTELVPGDVIATGTPSGVGHARKPPLYMKAGDELEVEITGLGSLRNPVADEAHS